jgi:D-alanyl-D-alanine carboxypeptidase (penicillin-binding protein 5/6)
MGSHSLRAATLTAIAACLLATPGTALAADDVIGGQALGQPGFVVGTGAGVPPLPATTSTSFVVADADTGAVLAAHNAHQRLAPASTLKTLTAITLLPRLDAAFPTMAQSDAPSEDGTKAGIVAGTMYKVSDLFTAMLMMSANDAAVALSGANGGVPRTLAEMNLVAAQLQANDTVARTPDGLDAAGQSSSAYDLALIFRAGLAMPQFKHYLALKTAAFPAPKGQSFQIQTHDKLLTDYPGMIGGKNGYTVAAQASYVGAATRGGHTIIVAIMRDQANFWPEEKALLDWGFAADATATPVGQLVGTYVYTPPVQPGTDQAAAVGPVGQPLGAGDATASAAKTVRAKHDSTGAAVTSALIWTAVGAAGLFFLAATAQLARRRRLASDTDERYLTGLTGLSRISVGSDEVRELT